MFLRFRAVPSAGVSFGCLGVRIPWDDSPKMRGGPWFAPPRLSAGWQCLALGVGSVSNPLMFACVRPFTLLSHCKDVYRFLGSRFCNAILFRTLSRLRGALFGHLGPCPGVLFPDSFGLFWGSGPGDPVWGGADRKHCDPETLLGRHPTFRVSQPCHWELLDYISSTNFLRNY